jgi:CheY-like chemotaxis protein
VRPRSDKRTILVVDDDSAIREELADALGQDPAVEVSVAKDGWAALEQIATGRFWPEVILLDLMMPGVDGDEFVAALEAISGTGQIAVVVMTAVRATDIPQGIRRRAHAILFKPFTLAKVSRAVRAALDSSGRRSPA